MIALVAFAALTGGAAAARVPAVKIGVDVGGKDVLLPLVGAGTWQYNDTTAYESVCKAFSVGYTMIDTANGYGNERGVGRAIKDCWKAPREDLFVMTKIPGGLNATETAAAHRQNLAWLQLDYVDHLMTHFPADWAVTPKRSSPAARQEEWRALELIYKSGEARSIGVSHYCASHLDDVMEIQTVRPSINQVEWHVGSGDVDAVADACRKHGVHFMSFSPLCGPCDYDEKDSLTDGELVTAIGRAHNVTGSQVSLRFLVQQALDEPTAFAGVIPKSNTLAHLQSNIDLFGFELSAEEFASLAVATQPAASGGDCDVP
ncbi:NADP-dependent oxidoreductase domain-containing protein [Pelagophyceae sp. CCMP2097]|nr:NADP-dependent oxidoreductase domain-containing protein [Pelagophyceae sp. CCMP2097]